MKIVKAKIYSLKIPFKFVFGHFLKIRFYSDSIIVELTTDTGVRGYGEGLARPYVTGETVNKCTKHIKDVLLPAIMQTHLFDIDSQQDHINDLSYIDGALPDISSLGIIAWNAARTAVELAVIDCILKSRQRSLNCLLPPKSDFVTYSGVLTSGSQKDTFELATRAKHNGLQYIKMKVGKKNDHHRLSIVRDIMGPSVSIRLDANGAFNVKHAIEFIKSVEKFTIDSIEQPIKRGNAADLAMVRANSSVPVMADESIVTFYDAQRLIEKSACDYFNLRISKCGGLFRTLKIAEFAAKAGVKVQLGCQVGETAILSAAGRHLAACFPDIQFVEGSYSTLLLSEDIAEEKIVFGHGGRAPLLSGTGLGITVKEELLHKYARKIVHVS